MLTKTEAACITAVTGTVMLEAKHFMAEVSKKLERKIYPEEFNNIAFRDEIRELFMEDFLKLCYVPEEEKSGLILPSSLSMP